MSSKLILFLVCAAIALAQAAGTVAVTSSTTITAEAGTVSCVITHTTPETSAAALNITCKTAAGSTLTEVINGLISSTDSLGSGSDLVSWQITSRTDGMLDYKVTANGTSKSGVF